MTPGDAFRDAESYYGTILHELVHSTKHPSRLDRDLGRKSWATPAMPPRNWSQNSAPLSCAQT